MNLLLRKACIRKSLGRRQIFLDPEWGLYYSFQNEGVDGTCTQGSDRSRVHQ